MRKKIKNNKLFSIVFVLLLLSSCDSKRVFDEYQTINKDGWHKNEIASFEFAIKDTVAKRNLFINLRNNNNYEFSNLFVITELKFPNNEQIIDTLEYDMADKTGKFLGDGFTEIKENKLFYKEEITFPTSGNYSVQIRQAMRKGNEVEGIETLKGITEVGFRIEKTN